MSNLVCSKCFKEITTAPQDDEYDKYKGDKKLWETYSHVAIIKDDVQTEPYPISSIYNYGGGINVNHERGDEGSSCHINMRPHSRKKDVYTPAYGAKYAIKLIRRK